MSDNSNLNWVPASKPICIKVLIIRLIPEKCLKLSISYLRREELKRKKAAVFQ